MDIYGKVRNIAGGKCFVPFRYQGQYEDEETGLYYNRFRYYSPKSGTYISQDPIGLAGNNPNTYAYVKDVHTWVDVFGLDCRKGSVEGGLNLFKWGAPHTGKETGWITGDYFLYLPNKGTPRLNWKANYGALRREMKFGKPIFDSYRLPNGNLIPSKGFLGAERFTLQTRGWIYSPNKGAWIPPNL